MSLEGLLLHFLHWHRPNDDDAHSDLSLSPRRLRPNAALATHLSMVFQSARTNADDEKRALIQTDRQKKALRYDRGAFSVVCFPIRPAQLNAPQRVETSARGVLR